METFVGDKVQSFKEFSATDGQLLNESSLQIRAFFPNGIHISKRDEQMGTKKHKSPRCLRQTFFFRRNFFLHPGSNPNQHSFDQLVSFLDPLDPNDLRIVTFQAAAEILAQAKVPESVGF